MRLLHFTLLVVCLTSLVFSVGVSAETVSIRVLDDAGKPVAGAKVVVSDYIRDVIGPPLTTDEAGHVTAQGSPNPYQPDTLGLVAAWKPGLALGGGLLKRGENTIRLTESRTLSGKVTDAEGAPVTGARVQATTLRGITGSGLSIRFQSHSFSEAVQAVTDATGRCTLRDLPSSGKLYVQLADPEWLLVGHEVDLETTNDAPALQAQPGATLEGRLVDHSGAPAPEVEVSSSPGGARARTDEAGNFKLFGLSTGHYDIVAKVPPGSELANTRLQGAAVTEGRTTVLPVRVLTPGIVVNGRVVDEETRRTLPEAFITTGTPNRIFATSGSNGQFQLRLAPGEHTISLITPKGYLPVPEKLFTAAPGEAKTLEFRLKRGLVLTGIVRDETGKPVAGVKLTTDHWQAQPYTMTGADGRFKFDTLPPGGNVLRVADPQWETVAPVKVSLPLKFVVIDLKSVLLTSVRGRVINQAGAPVAGASVNLTASFHHLSLRIESQQKQLTTDANGHYEWFGVRPDAEILLGVSKPLHRLTKKPAVTIRREIMGINGKPIPNPKATFEVSDAVLQPLTRTLKGTVTDQAGAPLAGIQVMAPEGNPKVLAITDAHGRWALAELPEGDFKLMAADARRFGQVEATDADNLIVLKPVTTQPRDIARGKQVLAEIIENTIRGGYIGRITLPMLLAQYDLEGALELNALMQAKPGIKPPPAHAKLALIQVLADHNPTLARANIPGLLEGFSTKDRDESLEVAFTVAPYAPEWALPVFQQVRASLKMPVADVPYGEIQIRTRLAALAAVLHQPRAEALLDEAIALTNRSAADQQAWIFGTIASDIAGSGADLVEHLLSNVPVENKKYLTLAYNRAIKALAKSNLPAARKLLEQMHDASLNIGDDSRQAFNTEFEDATAVIVQRLASLDAPAALTLAQRLKTGPGKARALILTAPHLPTVQAYRLFEEALPMTEQYHMYGATPVWILARAYQFDPALGDRLFNRIRKQSPKTELAFYIAPYRPGYARLLLEYEWVEQRSQAEEKGQPEGQLEVATTMSVIDAERALELAATLPPLATTIRNKDENENRWEAMRRIAQYLMASETARSNNHFDRWNEDDAFLPDEE
jgi:protocatechuate 3,4-dioxygenase beta subunit